MIPPNSFANLIIAENHLKINSIFILYLQKFTKGENNKRKNDKIFTYVQNKPNRDEFCDILFLGLIFNNIGIV